MSRRNDIRFTPLLGGISTPSGLLIQFTSFSPKSFYFFFLPSAVLKSLSPPPLFLDGSKMFFFFVEEGIFETFFSPDFRQR